LRDVTGDPLEGKMEVGEEEEMNYWMLGVEESSRSTQTELERQDGVTQTAYLEKREMEEDVSLISSAQYRDIVDGRKKQENSTVMGNSGLGEGVRVDIKEGSFISKEDGRIRNTYLRHRSDNMMNISCSFDPFSMVCKLCTARGPHSVLEAILMESVWLLWQQINISLQHCPAKTRRAVSQWSEWRVEV